MVHTEQCATCAMIQGILMSRGVTPGTAHEIAYSAPIRSAEKKVIKKAKRKVGKYQKVFGKKLRALKAKHPRTSPRILMKKAHRQTKAAMK